VKAPAAGAGRGWDGARRTVGRRRHIALDADGRLPMVNLTPADIADSGGAKAALRALRTQRPWMKTLFADSAYDRAGPMDEAAMLGFTVEVVRKIEGQTGFQVLPRRRVVERTFAWMTGWRRLVRDHEARVDVSEAMTRIAVASLLIRRLSHRARLKTDPERRRRRADGHAPATRPSPRAQAQLASAMAAAVARHSGRPPAWKLSPDSSVPSRRPAALAP
jgi:transposase